jgi:predicted short-subunit dehydrogenase-like oxidoreductase (DUF2520 family)
MRIIIVGPGRAGRSLAGAFAGAGHEIVGVVGKDDAQSRTAAADLETQPLVAGDPLPDADLVVISTRDAAIGDVAAALAPGIDGVVAAVHVSGLTPVTVLEPLRAVGVAVGSFHPLQSLPTVDDGAARLAGAWVAVTAAGPLRAKLHDLARSLGSHPFDLDDDAKPIYHAAAAAAANFPLVALAMAGDLFAAAGVSFAAARPLVDTVVENAFDLGARPALTGPVARGDTATVLAQLTAVASREPRWLPDFAASVMALARLTGRGPEFEDAFAGWEMPADPGDPAVGAATGGGAS